MLSGTRGAHVCGIRQEGCGQLQKVSSHQLSLCCPGSGASMGMRITQSLAKCRFPSPTLGFSGKVQRSLFLRSSLSDSVQTVLGNSWPHTLLGMLAFVFVPFSCSALCMCVPVCACVCAWDGIFLGRCDWSPSTSLSSSPLWQV